jgi:DNA-binding helix-hairpin-helix protein with protein kinase domain
MSNKLHFYTKYSKEKIKISDKPFASGGEGAIYAIASPRSYSHLVAKIYYPEKRTPEREAKMQYLMQHPPITFQEGQPPSIGWVQDLIYKDKRFIGILLIKIDGKKLTKLTLYKLPRRADKAWQRFSFKQPDAFKLRLRTCFNLAVVIHQIHESGQYVLVDLKPDNVLMQPNGLLAIVDMDSVEVIKDGVAIFSAPVATPEYTPPEHYWGPRGTIEEPWDNFSLGVIFYQLLLGLHPFAASCNPPYDNLVSIHDKIEKDLFVHHSEKQAFFKVIPPPHQQFYKIPVEIQHLFQNCFEHGAKEPYLRPSPGDWCNVLADVLKLPFKKIPKTNIPPSNLYFSPKILAEALSFTIPILPKDNSIPNLPSEVLTSSSQSLKKEALVNELKDAYIRHIHKHRERLLQTGLVAIISMVLFYILPPVFIVGFLVLMFLVAPQLFLNKLQTAVDSVGKAVLSSSTYKLLQIEEESTLKKDTVNSSHILIDNLLSKKKKALQEEKKQLSSNQTINRPELNFIHLHLQKQADLEQKKNAINDWIKSAEAEVSATREAELAAYKTASKDFVEQLKENPTYKAYSFISFRNLRMKIQQDINTIKGSLKVNERPLRQLEINQQKKLTKLTNIDHTVTIRSYRQNLESTAKKVLQVFKTKNQTINEHKEAYWAFTQKKKRLKNNNHQQLQKIEHQLNKSLQNIRKDLGLDSKSELIFYMDLLDNSQEELQLDYAHKQVRKRFDLFLQKIEAINIDPLFSAEIIKTLKEAALPKVSFDKPEKAKSIRTLTDLQQNMSNTWAANETKLKAFEAALEKLAKSPETSEDPIELAYWAKTGQEQLTNIVFNLEQYAEIQSVFYGDPVIFRLRNKLKTHREEAQYGAQKIKDLETDYSSKVKRLEDGNRALIEKQKELDFLIEEQKRLILEKEAALEVSVEKEMAKHLESLKQQDAKSLEIATKKHQKELEDLEKQTSKQQVSLLEKLKEAEETLEKLASEHESFQVLTDTIRSNAELVYTDKRLLTDQKCQEITNLVQEIQQEHPKALQFTKSNALYYQELKVRVLDYKDNLTDLNQLQEEKIRLDTLSEWQKGYNSRIYIQDLLLNEVEQFKQYEQKKK